MTTTPMQAILYFASGGTLEPVEIYTNGRGEQMGRYTTEDGRKFIYRLSETDNTFSHGKRELGNWLFSAAR